CLRAIGLDYGRRITVTARDIAVRIGRRRGRGDLLSSQSSSGSENRRKRERKGSCRFHRCFAALAVSGGCPPRRRNRVAAVQERTSTVLPVVIHRKSSRTAPQPQCLHQAARLVARP